MILRVVAMGASFFEGDLVGFIIPFMGGIVKDKCKMRNAKSGTKKHRADAFGSG